MFDAKQFQTVILEPVLNHLQMYTPEAVSLMLGTLANESKGGTYLVQQGGPALGVFQMEPRTHDDLWRNYLSHQSTIGYRLMELCGFSGRPIADNLVADLLYATAMARIFYYRIPEAIPKDIKGQATYYKMYYNTSDGKATIDGYIANYEKFVGRPKK